MRLVEAPRWRLVMAVLAGAVAAAAGSDDGVTLATLVGIAVGGLLFVTVGWAVLWPMDAEETKDHAQDQDLHNRSDEWVLAGAIVGGLGAIVALLVRGSEAVHSWLSALAALDVVLMWASLHLIYSGRYAHRYFALGGGIDFNDQDPGVPYSPRFSDFFYFSYNLGMTYQVSDTSVQKPEFRSLVLRHCLLSYLFGTAILATMINLVVGALTS